MTDPNPHEFIATFAAVLVTIALFLIADTALARLDSQETKSHAASEYTAGERLIGEGKLPEAIQHLRAASTLDRSRPAYTIALAAAILENGRPTDAENLLQPVLERGATSGAANLTMARILVKEGRTEEAKSYYHRAIYGLWAQDAPHNRSAARFELIDLLARTDERQELLAELLPIQDDSSVDELGRRRLGHLLLAAGSPRRAAAIFHALLQQHPQDADAYTGLGESALALGNFQTARADFAAAARLSPAARAIEARIDVADSAIAIDPTQRGLRISEEFRRSRNLVRITIASIRACLGATPTQRAAIALDSAERFIAPNPRAGELNGATEEDLALAQELWKLRPPKCIGRPTSYDEALGLIQVRLAQ